jgi:hypothetical protein
MSDQYPQLVTPNFYTHLPMPLLDHAPRLR